MTQRTAGVGARWFDLAQKESFERGNIEIGPEHLAYAVLKIVVESLDSPETSRELGIDLETASAAIDRRYRRGQSDYLKSDTPLNEGALTLLRRIGIDVR